MDLTERIEQLFADHGHTPYEGARREAISALEHALQCAQLAEWANADASLVAAAFLHDIGHFLAAEAVARSDRVDDRHELLAIPFLSAGFGAAVTEPVRLHVEAKRYLVRVDPHYAGQLSPASTHSLGLQGGAMSDEEIEHFESLPRAKYAVQLRRWDDLAKEPGKPTPPLAYYLALLDEVRERPSIDWRSRIATASVA
jgi:phosphonate degradation associated HDIG domain protein